jgi:peptide subunit release factor 1 (eRF1)
MAKTSPSTVTPLRERLEKLAAVEPQTDVPVLSLYLNLGSNQHGRDSYDTFIRKAFAERAKAFEPDSDARQSFDRDVERIEKYLTEEVNRATNGLALFASSGTDLFEAVQLEAPLDDHWLYVGSAPHLYPLARLVDQYPRYASVVLDTHRARIFVFSLGATERKEQVTGVKTRRNSMGGWSQARYQRHAENFHLHHVKEVVEALERIVRADKIQHIIVAGDDVVVPLVKEQLPQHLIDKLVDVLRLERYSAEDEILEATLGAMRRKDAETDAETVRELIDAWQGSGLGTVGPEAVLHALEMGQVDELLITGSETDLRAAPLGKDADRAVAADTSSPAGATDPDKMHLAGELVARAQQTSARIRFIEDPELLKPYGGVGALLRFRI